MVTAQLPLAPHRPRGRSMPVTSSVRAWAAEETCPLGPLRHRVALKHQRFYTCFTTFALLSEVVLGLNYFFNSLLSNYCFFIFINVYLCCWVQSVPCICYFFLSVTFVHFLPSFIPSFLSEVYLYLQL